MNERQETTDRTSEAYVAPNYELLSFEPNDLILLSVNIGSLGDNDDSSNSSADDW